MAAKPSKKERGVFLTVLIIIGFLIQIWDVVDFLSHSPNAFSIPWWNFYSFINLVFSFIALYGIWRWKKWGAILWVILDLIFLIFIPLLPISIGKSGQPNSMYLSVSLVILISILITGLYVWAFYRKWQYFE